MQTTATTSIITTVLTPRQLAELLGIDAEDAGLISLAPVRLPASFPIAWGDRLGPLELSTLEVGVIVGSPRPTIISWITQYGLVARQASRGEYRIAPAALVEFLRKRRGVKVADKPVETPSQQDRRAKAAKERAAEIVGRRTKPKRVTSA